MRQSMKTRTPFLLLLSLLALSVTLDACSGSTTDQDGAVSTGGNSSGGRTASGSSSGIDPDALAKNCTGLTVVDGTSCTKVDLVCRNDSGDLCLCGGLEPGGSQTWDCSKIGRPPGTGGHGGAGGEPNSNGGEAGAAPVVPSSGGHDTGFGGDANAGAAN
jgi:hypothetical protein